MTSPRTAKTTRKKTAKKASKKTAKKAAAKSENGKGAPAPIEREIRGEQKYKLKAAHLEWKAEEDRIIQQAQTEIQNLLNRKRRNDNAWKRTNKARLAAFNEVIDTMTPKLPAGFAILNVDPLPGKIRCEHNPELRGQHVT
jgi:hypothetical protein